MNIPDQIREKLAVLNPQLLDLRDDSAKHAGHAGAASGGGHYRLQIVSERFVGLTSVARHRLVYETLGEMMRREIHALAIEARTPGEAAS
ncbi:BolA family protein [Chitinimonas viridis]|uniref:BolA family protein n=2 Tax=Chitinimonas TaxID=240411 RepID=A0ABT8B335_9NEIS|nr:MULTISPECIES: BolA family protein [Chitinimonas]MBL8508519.1 BolA family transcriptional regulator [Chitinimonas sp.]MDN3576235.1 BolA family protein [Chitinimonas viridis]GLR14528.1 BolA family transcriptional regulator [Chitinimonas prasina]